MNRLLALIVIVALVPRVFLAFWPIDSHEALYAQSIDEFLETPRPFMTYIGSPVYHKPPMMLYLYTSFIRLFGWLPLPFELIYRLPSVLLGLASILMFYLLARRFFPERISLLSTFIFSFTNLAIYGQTALLTDPLVNALILLSVLLYTSGSRRQFALAWFVAVLAFLTKSVLSLIIPCLAVMYFFLSDRSKLKDPVFLLSLSGVVFGLAIYSTAFSSLGGTEDIGKQLNQDAFHRIAPNPLQVSIYLVFIAMYMFPWFIMSLLGARRASLTDTADKFFLAWSFLIFIPILSNTAIPTYLLPIVPPLSVFAAKAIAEKGFDRFSLIFLSMLTAVSLLVFVVLNAYTPLSIVERDVASHLAGKHNVLVITNYASGMIFYKNHFEAKPIRVHQLLPCALDEDYGCLRPAEYNWTNLRYYIEYNSEPFWAGPVRTEFDSSAFDYVVVKKELLETFHDSPQSSSFVLSENFSDRYYIYSRPEH